MKKTLLKNMILACTPDCKNAHKIKGWVLLHGGYYTPMVTDDTTHYLVSRNAWNGYDDNIKTIRKTKNTFIIKYDWLDDTLIKQKVQPEALYSWEPQHARKVELQRKKHKTQASREARRVFKGSVASAIKDSENVMTRSSALDSRCASIEQAPWRIAEEEKLLTECGILFDKVCLKHERDMAIAGYQPYVDEDGIPYLITLVRHDIHTLIQEKYDLKVSHNTSAFNQHHAEHQEDDSPGGLTICSRISSLVSRVVACEGSEIGFTTNSNTILYRYIEDGSAEASTAVTCGPAIMNIASSGKGNPVFNDNMGDARCESEYQFSHSNTKHNGSKTSDEDTISRSDSFASLALPMINAAPEVSPEPSDNDAKEDTTDDNSTQPDPWDSDRPLPQAHTLPAHQPFSNYPYFIATTEPCENDTDEVCALQFYEYEKDRATLLSNKPKYIFAIVYSKKNRTPLTLRSAVTNTLERRFSKWRDAVQEIKCIEKGADLSSCLSTWRKVFNKKTGMNWTEARLELQKMSQVDTFTSSLERDVADIESPSVSGAGADDNVISESDDNSLDSNTPHDQSDVAEPIPCVKQIHLASPDVDIDADQVTTKPVSKYAHKAAMLRQMLPLDHSIEHDSCSNSKQNLQAIQAMKHDQYLKERRVRAERPDPRLDWNFKVVVQPEHVKRKLKEERRKFFERLERDDVQEWEVEPDTTGFW